MSKLRPVTIALLKKSKAFKKKIGTGVIGGSFIFHNTIKGGRKNIAETIRANRNYSGNRTATKSYLSANLRKKNYHKALAIPLARPGS